MNQQSTLNILVAALVLVWIISRQLQARPVKEQNPYTLMIVLGAIGLYQVAELAGRTATSTAAYGALATGLVSGAVFGWLRGRNVHLWRADGVLTKQGNWLTIVLWVVGIVVHLGLDEAGTLLTTNQDETNSLGTTGILLYLAVTLAAQRFATLARARHLDGSAPARAY